MSSPTMHPLPKVEQSGNVRIITFTGDMLRHLEKVIVRELEGNLARLKECHLLLDFTNVESLNSAEMATLLALHKRMQDGGGRLTLFNLSMQVYEVFWANQLQARTGTW
jgi:anti-anti-sigma factor